MRYLAIHNCPPYDASKGCRVATARYPWLALPCALSVFLSSTIASAEPAPSVPPPVTPTMAALPLGTTPTDPTTASSQIEKTKQAASPRDEHLSLGALKIALNVAPRFEAHLSVPPQAQVQHLTLEHPGRIVIDFVGITARGTKSLGLNDGMVTAVRVAGHPDKIRVVFDLRGEMIPQYSIKERPSGTRKGFTLTIPSTHEESAARPTPKSDQLELKTGVAVTALPTQSPSLTITPHEDAPAVSVSPLPVPMSAVDVGGDRRASLPSPITIVTARRYPRKIEVAVSPTPAISREAKLALTPSVPTESSGGTMLKQVAFEYLIPEKTPVVRLALSQRAPFKISRIDERSYRIQFAGARPPANVFSLPQFPPSDFEGFTLVKAGSYAGGAEVIIGVERGIKLASFARGDDVLIRAIAPGE